MGLRLNEKRLTRLCGATAGRDIPTPNERAIFEALDIGYLEPTERDTVDKGFHFSRPSQRYITGLAPSAAAAAAHIPGSAASQRMMAAGTGGSSSSGGGLCGGGGGFGGVPRYPASTGLRDDGGDAALPPQRKVFIFGDGAGSHAPHLTACLQSTVWYRTGIYGRVVT